MGVLSNLKSTTSMRYDRDCVEFFSLFYIMFGGSAVNVLRGTTHFGSLVEKDTYHGHYDPLKGSFNFAIPSLNTLCKIANSYPKNIYVGFIGHSLDMAQEQAQRGAQFVIGFDGKMVAQGCKGESNGDVNLWGREKPSIAASLRNLRIRKYCAVDIQHPSSEEDKNLKLLKYQRLSLHMSRTLHQLCCSVMNSYRQRQKLIKLVNDNPDNVAKYNTRMSFLHQHSAESETVLNSGMDVQRNLLESMVRLHGHKVENSEIVVLSEKPNCFQLMRPDDIKAFINLQDTSNCQYIKQRTVEWEVLRSTAQVTGSTLNAAIGLDTLARQKQHHYEFVCGHGRCVTGPHVQQHLKHGSDNDVNIIATLVSLIMPAFLPTYCCYFEVGPVIIQYGRIRIVVSADSIIRCPNGKTCKSYAEHGERVIVLEFKSPFPTKENPNVTVYDTPPHHVPQLLVELKAWSSSELWLLCGTQKSVTVFRCYDENTLIDTMLETADELYGGDKPVVPTRLHTNVKHLKEHVRDYIKLKTSFLHEAPSLKGEYGTLKCSDVIKSAYSVTPNLELTEMSNQDVDYNSTIVSSEAIHFFTNAHTALRSKASEIVVFMATNKDRMNVDAVGYSFPVAYALKGSTMTNADLPFMVDLLQDEFNRREIPILTEVYDGQWHNHITFDANGKLLTSQVARSKCLLKTEMH